MYKIGWIIPLLFAGSLYAELSYLGNANSDPIVIGKSGLKIANPSATTYKLTLNSEDFITTFSSNLITLSSTTGVTKVDFGTLDLETDAFVCSTATLSNGAVISNLTNNAVAITENAEDIIATFGTNLITYSSSTGVTKVDFGVLDLETDVFSCSTLAVAAGGAITGKLAVSDSLRVDKTSLLSGTVTFGAGVGTLTDVAGLMTITEDTVTVEGVFNANNTNVAAFSASGDVTFGGFITGNAKTRNTVTFAAAATRAAVAIAGVTNATFSCASWVGDSTSAAFSAAGIATSCKTDSLILLIQVADTAKAVSYIVSK